MNERRNERINEWMDEWNDIPLAGKQIHTCINGNDTQQAEIFWVVLPWSGSSVVSIEWSIPFWSAATSSSKQHSHSYVITIEIYSCLSWS